MKRLVLTLLTAFTVSCASLHPSPIEFSNFVDTLASTNFINDDTSVVVPGEGDWGDVINRLVASSPCSVYHTPQTNPAMFGLAGWLDDGTCHIIIYHSTLNTELSTLLHESTHVMAYQEGLHLASTEAEVTAETVAYLAGVEIGLNTQKQSAAYVLLKEPDPDKRAHILFKYADQVSRWRDALVRRAKGE